ncbi:hypothetical protein QTJ16_003305 [Diplocarpon rosae]|uniref:Uncharacterized protein n=1 Tax=Diplocarpon rosae TaxID=946125 RepID=A0AAD9T2F2_9HELO|nr:hypothetical protein QTJ16_003305 [Diplocarpon rosae]PBP25348.1 hypothetical protein BUE80_DR003735 [Diplocarpon rosae]
MVNLSSSVSLQLSEPVQLLLDKTLRASKLPTRRAMGRNSKFSFPLPGWKTKDVAPFEPPPSRGGPHLSKAQRLLGTSTDLNIDISPIRDDAFQWRHLSSRSSIISISVSESSAGSIHETEQRGLDAGNVPRSPMLSEKASSTLLAGLYMDDDITATSDRSGRLRNEDSSSTLKSYYDRQKIPLSISQQTSASSARDMALRKGCPSIIQPSPLLNVETLLDPIDEQLTAGSDHDKGVNFSSTGFPERRKKPSRLDLSMLLPKSRRNGTKSPDLSHFPTSPFSASTHGSWSFVSEAAKRKLRKSQSKELFNSQKLTGRPEKSQETCRTSETLANLYDHYEKAPARPPRTEQIPALRVADRSSTSAERDSSHLKEGNTLKPVSDSTEPHSRASERDSFSWKNVGSSMGPSNLTPSSSAIRSLTPSSLTPPAWESTSAASISSRNTRTSKNTAGSILSRSDLQEKSVLSLSSDSEGDSDTDLPIIPLKTHACKISLVEPPPSPKENEPSVSMPEPSTAGSQLFGSWVPTRLDTSLSPSYQLSQYPTTKCSNNSSSPRPRRASRESKALSITSIQSSQAQTPLLSPTSMVFRQTADRSSRFMAVTQQEEALLEALRQKRAKMREKIIEEHETTKSPLCESKDCWFPSNATLSSSSASRPGTANKEQTILLYLDTSLSATHKTDAAANSPDLEDFLSFGPDDELMPRNSWRSPHRGNSAADSVASPLHKEKNLPLTPPSAVRLSAVGAADCFKPERNSGLASKKRDTGISFGEGDSINTNGDSFLVGNDDPMLWNV